MDNKPTQCNSLVGSIFGHSFEHIYDEDTRMTSPREYDHMCAIVQATAWGITREEMLRAVPVEQTVVVYRMSICKRCGYTIQSNE